MRGIGFAWLKNAGRPFAPDMLLILFRQSYSSFAPETAVAVAGSPERNCGSGLRYRRAAQSNRIASSLVFILSF